MYICINLYAGPASRSGTPGSAVGGESGMEDLVRFNRKSSNPSNDMKNRDIELNNYLGGGDNNYKNDGKNSLIILPSSLYKNTLNSDNHFVSNGISNLNIHTKAKSGNCNDMTESNNLKEIMIFKESFSKQHTISSPAISSKSSSKPKSIRENR